MITLDVIQHVSIRHEQIARAVVVIIEEPRSEATHVECGIRKLGAESPIIEGPISHVLIEARQLHIEMGDDQVHAAAARCVRSISSHSCLELTVTADRHSCEIGNFSESSVAIVVKQRIGHVIVGDKNVLPAVVVVVEGDNAQSIRAFQSHP